jgi:hypothetical protein
MTYVNGLGLRNIPDRPAAGASPAVTSGAESALCLVL